MHFALALLSLASPGWMILAALATAGIAFGAVHSGSFDLSAQIEMLQEQVQSTSLALVANSTLPAGAITGATDAYLANTTNAPGTQTTRTAAQMYADITAALGFAPPPNFQYVLTISHGGTGTLTLAGGTGVTFSSLTSGTATTIATLTGRQYLVTVNPTAVTIVNLASLSA